MLDGCAFVIVASVSTSSYYFLSLAASLVVFNCKGDDALSRLKAGKRKVDLVLTETNLPDMCGFMFIQIVDIEFKLPVVSKFQSFLRWGRE